MPTTDRLREDCGGPRFLDLSGLLLVLPFGLVTSVLSSAPPDLTSSWKWLLANLAAFTITAVVIVGARAVRRAWPGRTVPMTIVIATGGVVGAVKGVSTSWCASLLNLIDDPWRDAWGRGANTIVIGALTIPALAALMAAQDRWRAERDLLMVELVRRSLDAGDDPSGGHRHELQRVLERTRTAVCTLDHTDAAAELRRVVDHDIRPLSARIMAAAQPPPISQGRELLRVAVRSEPWSVGTVTALFTATTWMLLVRHVDAVEALVRCSVPAALTVSSVWCGCRLRRRFPRWAVAILCAVLIAQGWGQWLLGNLVFGALPSLAHIGTAVTAAVWLGELLVAIAMITAARRQRDHMRAQLLDLLGPQGVRDAVGHGLRAIEGRQFALFLHGHLQNQLTAAAQRLESTDDPDERRQTVATVLALLDEVPAPTMDAAPLSARLAEVAERWRGLADLDVALEPRLASLTGELAERVTNVVVEAVTNAMRHGAAQCVTVEVAAALDQAVVVTVTDDGFGPRRGRAGTGSHYLDIVTRGHWALTPHPNGGAQLTARLDHATT